MLFSKMNSMWYKIFPLLCAILVIISCSGRKKHSSSSLSVKKLKTAPEVYLKKLPDMLNESSALIYFRNKFWTVNDSDNSAELYGIEPSDGRLSVTIEISNAENVDWEALTQDEHCIYIGDFGNNFGNRRDLAIYKIPKQEMGEQLYQEIDAEKISFSYADQKSFVSNYKKTAYDCEAMICFRDSIYLFTKSWTNNNTLVYSLPKKPGEYLLRSKDCFRSQGLITDAAILHGKDKMVLLGYQNYTPFILLINSFKGDDFFSGNITRIEMPSIHRAQTEGICFSEENKLVISCEDSDFPAQLFFIDLSALDL